MTASTCLLIGGRRCWRSCPAPRGHAADAGAAEHRRRAGGYLFSDVAFGRIGKRVAGLLLSCSTSTAK
ncbi:hypothetical protein HBB16_00240 [Pseudonocardia sp. MCCB 268]|nr:hypothetical protein [Pseudonocardia cytotoxica]